MRLRVRNEALQFVREVEFRSADLRVRWNRPSTFTVEMAADQAEGLRRGSGLVFDLSGQVILSGLVHTRSRRDDRDDDVVELIGRCDMWRLKGRLVFPDPDEPADGAQPDRWDRSGPAGEVLAEMVELNAGPSARTERVIDALTVDDATGVGDSVRARRRFPVLSEEIERLGRQGGVVCRLRQPSTTPQMQFTVTEQADRSRLVVFSEARGNLYGYDVESEHPQTTVAIVGGPGEASEREVREHEDAGLTSEFGRWESWVDARNAAAEDDDPSDINDALEDEGLQHLDDHGPQEHIAVDTVETSSSRWLDHWDVGDLVTVEVDGLRLTKTVEAVEVQVSAGDGPDGGPVVVATPVLGRQSPRSQLKMLARLGEVERSVAAKGKE